LKSLKRKGRQQEVVEEYRNKPKDKYGFYAMWLASIKGEITKIISCCLRLRR